MERLNEALVGVGMEGFYPDGKTSQEKGIEELKKSDAVIFIVSPYYGSLVKNCVIPGCKYENECKDFNISYTHCEFKIAQAENKPYQTYLIHKGWNLVDQLKDLQESELKFVKKFKDFEGMSDDDIRHYHKIAKQALKFKEEVGIKFCKRIEDINDIPQITEQLAENIVKWYSENKINLMDFFGRREQLKELIEKMSESVEVYGIGGVGKTTLIHIALLIQRLKGKKIITVCLAQSESSGSGYGFFKKKFRAYPTLKNDLISLDDIMSALSIPDNIRLNTDTDLKIREISQKLTRENILLFIDDFQFADENVSKLVKKGDNFVIATRKKLNIARNSISLSGIETNEINAFIGWLAGRFDKKISHEITEKIFQLAQGHPLSTEILVRNYEKINFDEFENYKSGLDMCNEEQVEEFIKRIVKDILSDEAFDLLKNLSIINPELENNLDRKALRKTYPAGFDKNFNELIDAVMLDKKNNTEGIYEFTYRHIRDILKDDTKERHERAKEYYENKINKNQNDEVEILFHRSISSPDKKLIDDFLELKEKLSPVHYGFRRMVDVGELLRKSFDDETKAPVCGTLGALYYTLRNYEAAESAYTEALKIYKKLAEKAKDVYLPDVAMTQNNLGILYRTLQDYEAAESAYTEALEIRKKLVEKAPDVYLPDCLQTMANTGMFYFDINRIEEGINILEDVLKRRDLLPDFGASCFAGLGKGYEKTGKTEKAAQNYFIASSVYFLLFRKYELPCLEDVVSNLKKVPVFSNGELKGDAQLILAIISKPGGGEVEIPDVVVSRRGAALKEVLNGRRVEFEAVDEADMMIKALIGDLLKV